MKALFSYRVNLSGAYFALYSFIIGNILFLLFLATEGELIIGAAIIFMALLGVLTPVVLIILLLNALLNLKDIRQHLTAMFMVLLNIPISFFYINLLSDL